LSGDLGLVDGSKQVKQCKPYPEHLENSSQVVKELKERDTHVKQEGREVVKRSLESGQLGDVVVVENFGKRARVSRSSLNPVFFCPTLLFSRCPF
jgi:hypothetical protein